MYSEKKIRTKINGELIEQIPVSNGIWQGDSLSTLLLSIVMDKIMKQVRKLKGYKMGNKEVKILCHADDAVPVAKSGNDLQRLSKKFNVVISAARPKFMTTSKTPIRCKLVVDDIIIHQEGKFKYLGRC